MKTRLRSYAVLVMVGAAAFGSWAFVLNRVISWGNAPGKALVELTLSVALTAAAWQAWRRQERWMSWIAAALLGFFLIGEGHRLWLRESYGATEGGAQSGSLWHPITTTDLAIDRYTLDAARLPRDRLRVVHLSDPHVNELLPRDYFARVASEVRALEPDILVLTGDYISKAERVGLLQTWLDELPRATLGSYAVLGNHDYWTQRPELVQAALERAKILVLAGECVVSDGVRVCGTDAPWGPALAPSVLREKSTFTLVLSHTPDNIYDVAEGGADAMFAGHTHGGQARLPVLGALIVPSRYGRRFDRGRFAVGGTSLFVSPGIGADAPAFRLWCRPAVVVVDFVHR